MIVHSLGPNVDALPLIQTLVNYMSDTGGVIHLDRGDFYLSGPIILPRTGPVPTTSVQIEGDGMYSTNLHGMASFPTGRGFVEWDSGRDDKWGCYGQKISNMTMWLPNGIDGVKAIWHKVSDDALTSYANVQREWLQMNLENLRIECNNTDHEVLIDLGVGCRYSRWVNINADPWSGPSPKYDTLLVRTPTTYEGYSNQPADDGVGFGFGRISGLWPQTMRGGTSRAFQGRMFQATLEDHQDNGGRYGTGAISIHLVNSSNVTLRNLACEPTGSQFIRIENGVYVTADHIAGGCPGRNDGQSSIVVVGSRHIRLSNRLAALGEPCFSQFGLKLLSIDAGCVDVVAENFDVTVSTGAIPDVLASEEILIDPAAKFCRASGLAVQAWSSDGKGYREKYDIGN